MDEERSTCGKVYLGICLEPVTSLGKISSCEHSFHFKCIFRWSRVSNQCPTCRLEFNEIQQFRYSRLLKKVYVRDKHLQEDSDDEDWQLVCGVCDSDANPENFLICDGEEDCYNAFHIACVGLTSFSTERWLCPECQEIQELKDRESDAVASKLSSSDFEEESDVIPDVDSSSESQVLEEEEDDITDSNAEYEPDSSSFTEDSSDSQFEIRKSTRNQEEIPRKRTRQTSLEPIIDEEIFTKRLVIKNKGISRNWLRRDILKQLEGKEITRETKARAFIRNHIDSLI